MPAKVDISIILPCYNEGDIFEKSVDRIIKVLRGERRNWELIFVEDKSTDETKKRVEKIIGLVNNSHGLERRQRAIYHDQNQGRGKSVADGIKAARGKICGYLDVDLEVSASYIPLFIGEIEKGAEMVVAKRFYEGGKLESLTRYLASKIYALGVSLILNIPVEDTEAGYKFFNRKKILPVLEKVKNKHWFWDTEICARAYMAGIKIHQIPVLFIRKPDKKSTVKILPDTFDFIKNLFKFKYELLIKNK